MYSFGIRQAPQFFSKVDLSAYLLTSNIAPIGVVFPHYSEDDGTFDSSFEPASLYGGVWSLIWNIDYIYLSSEGGASGQSRVSGKQPDQFQGFYMTVERSDGGIMGSTTSAGSTARKILEATAGSGALNWQAKGFADAGYGTPRVGSFTHPRNRLVRYYRRDS